MKVAVQRGKGRLSVEEVPRPTAGPGQILVEIAYCGICGSDLHYFDNEKAPSGNVLGHEWSGTVIETGEGVTRLAVGDRVTMARPPEWLAPPLPSEPPSDISDLLIHHPVAHAGGFAEYLLYYADAVHRLPKGVSLEEGALTDTLGVGLEAANRSGLKIGDAALVIGAGPIGLVTLMAARLAGAGLVVVTERSETRRAAAGRCGADLVLDPSDGNFQMDLLGATSGAGFDVVFECAGVPATIQQAVDMVKRSGTVALVGVSFAPAEIQPAVWYVKDVTVTVVPGGDLRLALGVMARKMVDAKQLISHIVALDGIQQAFEGLLRPTDQIKVLVKP